ncbi:GNAT family N-acetyltransferase [Reinekea blandensis]|uniref:Acetyltransferase, GNAT family protein n=1 Tax=Reinekea blandensis MED297 TaxID=314283 RepID=A4BCR2_9GAMM|nr:GNAT family N-acetyltransferase [Reinekea blandensis]EAR09994.1 acetyltransferase, GNAT family protein [Reinekea sp. MED297] [Reinekea blandensis MED297]
MLQLQMDALTDGAVIALLNEHRQQMQRYSPAESIHALDEAAIRQPEVTFWSVRDGDTIAGCGALKALNDKHGEIKSMKTSEHFLRQGVAAQILDAIIAEARQRGYQRLSLETGTHEAFLPAIRLYQRAGFIDCEPFADYQPDPHSRFLSLTLS